MKLINMKCPNCGADLQIDTDASNSEVTCPYCGHKAILDDEQIKIDPESASQAGYEFEKGRQKAKAEEWLKDRVRNVSTSASKSKATTKHPILWFMLAFCIVCMVIGVVLIFLPVIIAAIVCYLIWKKWNGNQKHKIIATVIVCLIASGLEIKMFKNHAESEAAEQATEVATDDNDEGSSDSEDISDIATFVDRFNEVSETKLEYVEDFDPTDETGIHYHSDYSDFKNLDPQGKSYIYGDTTIDIVQYGSITTRFCIYADSTQLFLEDMVNIVKVASPLFSPETEQSEIEEVTSKIMEGEVIEKQYYGYISRLKLTITADKFLLEYK